MVLRKAFGASGLQIAFSKWWGSKAVVLFIHVSLDDNPW